MWQRFTERARRVVFFAQEEAGRRGENLVTPTHLLMGVVREDDSVAARILIRAGVDMAQIREQIALEITPGSEANSETTDFQLTPRTRRVIDLAYDEARLLNNNYIGTEHLLLGLVREDEGLTGKLLAKPDIDFKRIRDEVISLQDAQPDSTVKATSEGAPISTDYLSRVPHGELGVARAAEGRTVVEVAIDDVAFMRLVDVFAAKDAYGYRAMANGDQTMYRIPSETPLKALVPTVARDSVSYNKGQYVRILSGDYEGYAGWIFRECFERTGKDDAPFPPTIKE